MKSKIKETNLSKHTFTIDYKRFFIVPKLLFESFSVSCFVQSLITPILNIQKKLSHSFSETRKKSMENCSLLFFHISDNDVR